MNIFKIFGIDRITAKMVFMAIFSLLLMGVSVNSIYDLIKLILSSWITSDKYLIFMYLGLPSIFVFWIAFLYQKYKPAIIANSTPPPPIIMPHRGIIMVLSTPRETPETINQQILEAADPSALYKIQSIGQLFKGLGSRSNMTDNLLYNLQLKCSA